MPNFSKQTIQNYPGWDEFYARDVDEKRVFFSRDDRLYDVIFSQQFDRPFLDAICRLSNAVRLMAKTRDGSEKLRGLLAHKRAMLYFVQPSTRTFLSFLNACHILGLKVSDIRDTFHQLRNQRRVSGRFHSYIFQLC